MARLGIWDNGLSTRLDASRGLVARRAFRANGKDYAAGEAFPRSLVSPPVLRRLYTSGRLAYAPAGQVSGEPQPLPIPKDYAKLPFFSLRSLAKQISGEAVADKPQALDIVHAEMLRRARAA